MSVLANLKRKGLVGIAASVVINLRADMFLSELACNLIFCTYTH